MEKTREAMGAAAGAAEAASAAVVAALRAELQEVQRGAAVSRVIAEGWARDYKVGYNAL